MAHPGAPEIPTFLSALPRKRSLYAADTYFRESFEDLSTVGGGRVEQFCHDHALLLLKPDAVVSRRLGAVLRWVLANGFSIVWAATVALDRHGVRALWQYGLNAASRDRRDAADLYVTACECLLLLLALPGRPEPASSVLSAVKGPADPGRCRPGQLRYDVGSFNYQLNLVHAADEPADLLRELAVLCDHETRAPLYRRTLDRRDGSVADGRSEAFALVERLESATPAVDLHLDRTLRDLTAAAERRTEGVRDAGAPGAAGELAALLGRVRGGRSRDWRGVLRLAECAEVPVSRWQRIVLATHLLDPYVPGATSLLPDSSDAGESR
ncbi:nucleoside-diphosphate kinase [Plantactinospora sp. CA-290183]|uniref:nucleoside-diphosphate kinase n=1 Tax=Plantactinospora sp. CA-290183 TaxID=3240006 RepID=UPI003D8A3BC2